MEKPGYFWCDQCQEFITNLMKEHHLASHEGIEVIPISPIPFFVFCLMAGVGGALAVIAIVGRVL